MEAFTWGIELNAWLQTFSNPVLDGVFKVITALGSEEFYVVLIPLTYWCLDRRIGARIAFLFLFSAYVNLGLKNLFASPRPFQAAPDRVRALVETESYGFPSAHAQGAATVWGYLAARLGRWLWVAGIGVPFAIGMSRMYLGVHSPADVLGGWAVGAGCVALGVWGASLTERWWVRAGLPLRLAGSVAVPLALAAVHPSRLTINVMAALAGTGAGIALERRYVRFSARGAWWRRVARFLLGAAVLLALYLGLELALPGEDRVGRTVVTLFSAARYCLAGLWVLFAGPLLFVKMRLATRETQWEGPTVPARGGPRAPHTQTIRLREVEGRDAGLVGAKALSLARMMRARLPVPHGFCVTGAAYREHVSLAPRAGRTKAMLDDLGNREDTARGRVLAELREAIVETPLSGEFAREIERRYRVLGAKHVAVRSSATAEDLPDHSFAGQYDTFLGVTDLAGCLEAVRKCWASLWTERAFDYRERNGINHLGVDMAVIVQELVPAEASGVLFTADPVTGRRDRLVIESCFGLGETLVSGKVTPDRFVLSKRKLRVLERTVATKTVETLLDPTGGGVRERTIAGDRAARPCLNDAAARRLGKLALKAEKAFGSPQDVEWAAASGRLYILQSRPITTLAPAKSWEDRQVWTNTNAGEVLPDVATPLTWSIIEPSVNGVFREMFAATGIDISDRPVAGLVAGRIYYNATTLMGTLRDIPFMGEVVDRSLEVFGGDDAATAVLERAMSDGPPRSFLGRLWICVRGLGLVRKLLWHTPERCELFIAGERRTNRKLNRIDAASLSDTEIVSWIRNMATDFMGSRGSLFPPVSAGCFVALDDICRRWFGDADGTLARRLVGGLSGMQSAEAGLALWQLADLAGWHEGVAGAVLSERTFEAVRARIAREAGGDEFLAEWRAFMREHGHHTRGELEIGNPRWSERPDEVLAMVRGYLEGVGRVNPVARQAALAADRRRLTRECRLRLRNPVKRILFYHILKKAQRGCLVRENLKSESVRGVAVFRRMLLELGRRFVERGVFVKAEDIFFLRFEEIEPVVQGAAPADVRETIAGRRAEHERNLEITPPSIVVGRFDPDDFVPDAVDGDATMFEGIAASTGVVTGPARVVTRAGEDTVRPGEILVAPFTDPSWAPCFVNAAGIVMDMGGLLSHGSIIAREYGIPAVVNVGSATKIIRTGQMLHVDGDRGVVSVLEAGPTDPGRLSQAAAALSVRPDVPAARRGDTFEDRQVWSNMNTGEVMPDVVTPFSWSAMELFLDNAFHTIFGAIGLDLGENPAAGLIAGRLYFNISALVGMTSRLPFARDVKSEMSEATRMLGGDEAAVEALYRVTKGDVPRLGLRRLWVLLRWPGFVRWVLWHSPERGERFVAGLRRATRKLDRLDAASLSDAEIVSWIRHAQASSLGRGSALLFAFVAMGYFVALDKVCRRWFDDADGTLARRLVGGVSGMQSAEAGLALWRVAELASRDEGVAGAVLSERTFEAVRGRLAGDRAGAEFLARWDEFMDEHGHHTRGELEYANPRWSETPDEVLTMVRGYLEDIGRANPVARQAALAADRRRLTRECRLRLRNPIKRIVFDHLLRKAQRGCLLRENGKSEVVRRIAILRRMLLELGRRLVERGVFVKAEDISFLRFEEVEPVVQGSAPADVRETIAGRRAEHQRNLAITPPSVVVGRFDPDDFVPDAVGGDATTFEGIASSPGVVTGPARVVTRAGQDTVRPGEILVAPFTDPGWTPFFVNAAGIVMDMGGLLSHGSIIAREYGIPAVVNVGPATKIIRTGQLIEVNGDRGRARILGD